MNTEKIVYSQNGREKYSNYSLHCFACGLPKSQSLMGSWCLTFSDAWTQSLCSAIGEKKKKQLSVQCHFLTNACKRLLYLIPLHLHRADTESVLFFFLLLHFSFVSFFLLSFKDRMKRDHNQSFISLEMKEQLCEFVYWYLNNCHNNSQVNHLECMCEGKINSISPIPLGNVYKLNHGHPNVILFTWHANLCSKTFLTRYWICVWAYKRSLS